MPEPKGVSSPPPEHPPREPSSRHADHLRQCPPRRRPPLDTLRRDVTASLFTGPWIGIAAGLLAALASALSYLVSRHHVLTHPEFRGAGGARLIVQAHGLMGLACIPASWLLWPRAGGPPAVAWMPPTVGCAAIYLLGQACFFKALERVPASKLSPLLGLKVVMLATIVSTFLGSPLDGRQWMAVGLAVAAALSLQRGDDRVPPASFALVLVACLCFALADLQIVALLRVLATEGAEPLGRFHSGCLGMCLTYVACGALLLPWGRSMVPRTAGGLWPATHYALVWLVAMIALYACLGTVGAVFGNILQGTRGVMSVILGGALAHLGWHELEEKVDRRTFAARIAAAMAMAAAIALYASDPD